MSETYIDNAGVRLWTISEGEGPPIMLCNGGPGMADYLQPVADMLTDTNTVLRWEQRGCGHSDATGPYTLATCFADLNAIRQHFGIERWIIGGHSFGADLALLYTLAHPEVVQGVLCLAGGRITNDRGWHAEYDQHQHEEIVPATAYPHNMEVNRQLGADWKEAIHHPLLLRDLAKLQTPALFLYGERDIRPSWAVEQVARLMPKARFVLLADSPHVLWLKNPADLSQQLRSFVHALS